jgi:hypothetical protein
MIRSFTLDSIPDEQLNVNLIKAQLIIGYKRYEFAQRFERTNSQIKYIGFLVGAVLCVLGSMIVIKGVRENESTLNIEGLEKAKIKFTTSSPGLIVVFIGGLIVIATIWRNVRTDVIDPVISLPGMIHEQESKGGFNNPEKPFEEVPLIAD